MTATAPLDQSLPSIAGSPRIGNTLGASTGTWAGSPPLSFAYQWQRCNPACSDIAGATGSSYTLTVADVGGRLLVIVTASNSAGSASASSGQVGPVAAAPPTAAAIKALLLSEITPKGKAARIGALLKARGYSLSFKALSAGSARVDWFFSSPRTPKPVLVARGRRIFDAAGTSKLKVTLTAAGIRLLKHSRHLKLTAKGRFTPTGGTAVRAHKTFTLKR